MKNKYVRLFRKVGAALLVGTVIVSMAVSTGADDNPVIEKPTISKHEKINVNDVTGEGQNPQEINGFASAAAANKQWFEYITYNNTPAGEIRFSNDNYVLLYDPYVYNDALIMELTTAEEWSSADSVSVTYETSNTISIEKSKSDTSDTGITRQIGVDMSGTEGTSSSQSRSDEESYSRTEGTSTTYNDSINISATAGTEVGTSITITEGIEAGVEAGVEVGSDLAGKVSSTVSEKISTSLSETVNSNVTASATVGETHDEARSHSADTTNARSSNSSQSTSTDSSKTWSTVSDRITASTGTATSVSNQVSTSDSKSITRTFNAAYFNSSGAPLQWRIAQYTVYMPLYYEEMYFINGEWVMVDNGYCKLATIQGTCRSWMEDGQAYYEHWGTGEKVLQKEFWQGFFSTDDLVQAYEERLYPD